MLSGGVPTISVVAITSVVVVPTISVVAITSVVVVPTTSVVVVAITSVVVVVAITSVVLFCLFCFDLVSAVAQDMKLSMRKKEK